MHIAVAKRADAITECLRRKNTGAFITSAVVTSPHCSHFYENVQTEATENLGALTKVSLVPHAPTRWLPSVRPASPCKCEVQRVGVYQGAGVRRDIPLVVTCDLFPLQFLSCTRSKTGPVSPSSLDWKLWLDSSFPAPWEHPYHLCHLNHISSLTSHVSHGKAKTPPVHMCETPGVPPKSTGLVPLTAEGISLPNMARCCQICAACYLSPLPLEVICCFSIFLPPTKLLGDSSKIVSASSSST